MLKFRMGTSGVWLVPARSRSSACQHSSIALRRSHFEFPSASPCLCVSVVCLFHYLKRNGPHGKSGHSAFDLVGGRNVTELVASVARQLFQAVKLADVDTLLDQQVLVHRIETAAPCRCRTHFEA